MNFTYNPVTKKLVIVRKMPSQGANPPLDQQESVLLWIYNQLSQSAGNRDQLLEKLNYMIHLLEEQKDEKTGYVMEEIILFSFLGVFIIFIVDSFARVSKYER